MSSQKKSKIQTIIIRVIDMLDKEERSCREEVV